MRYNQNSGFGQSLMSSLPLALTGKIFVVGDSGTVNRDMLVELFGYDPDGELHYYATIDAAVSACTASAGDIVLVAPGHTETISSATALVMDIAGVSVIGIGQGTLRPTLTLDTATAASIPVSVNDVKFENMIFSANFADIVAPFTLTTAKNFQLVNCAFQATATNMNFLSIVDTNTTNNAADGLVIEGCSWIEPDLATLSFLDLDADMDGFVFKGNYVNLGVNTSDLPAIAVVATGKDLTNAQIGGVNKADGNVIIRLNDANPLLITADSGAANTGYVANNYVRHLDTASELLVTTTTNFGFFENYATAAVDASGYILPAVDS